MQPSKRRRQRRYVIGLLCLVVLVLAGTKGWRLWELARALQDDVRALEATARTPDADTPATIGPLLDSAYTHAVDLRGELDPLLPITRRLHWLPAYGADIAAADTLLDGAIHLTSALRDLNAASVPLLAQPDGTRTLTATLDALHTARPQIEQAQRSLEQAQVSWAPLQTDQLSPATQRRVQRVTVLVPLLASSTHLALAADDIATALLPIPRLDNLDDLPVLAERLAAARPALERSRDQLDQALASWKQIPREDLPDALRTRVEQADPMLALFDAGLDLTLAADDASAALSPLLTSENLNEPLSVALNQHVLAARPALERAQQSLTRMTDALEALPSEALPNTLQATLHRAIPLLPALHNTLDLALVLPDMLGAQSPHPYLIVAQNPDELRATGGFISGAGVLTFTNGSLNDVFYMRNAADIDRDRWLHGPYLNPPPPLRRYMGLEQWGFHDSNWSPDFPTSAAAIRSIYSISQHTIVTDVIAFDPVALQLLLEATGPLQVEGITETITADNLMQQMRTQYTLGYAQGDRDAFIGPLAEALLARLRSGTSNLDVFDVVKRLKQALDERHILIATRDPDAADVLARLEWDGRVQPGDADFLMVVDTNMGYSKANPYLGEAITYTVNLSTPTVPVASLTVQHTHLVRTRGDCDHYTPYQPGQIITYEALMRRCHWNYLRVLVPGGSELITATMHPTPAAWLVTETADDGATHVSQGEGGTTLFSTFLVVPLGEQSETVFRYLPPANVVSKTDDGRHYRLEVQKQAGREPIPFTLQIIVPDTASIEDVSPAPAAQAPGMLTFTTRLDTDKSFAVEFR